MANRAWRNELNNRSYMYNTGYGNQGGYNSYQQNQGYNDRRFTRDDYSSKRGKREYPGRYDGVVDAKRGRDNQSGPKRGSFRDNKGGERYGQKGYRYTVKVPKNTFDMKEGSYSLLKARYHKLYVPSDFFHSDFRWQDVFQLHTPMELGNKATYQIFNKEVEPLNQFDSDRCEPADANYIYSAKVMLINQPDKQDFIKTLTEGSSNINRSIQFLVGNKGKSETMAIGGPWSPSLDGANPDEDPQVLINTAIRTCKELTGIDLTPCKEWHRFIEFHYYRPADRQGLNASTTDLSSSNVETDEYRVETVVIFIPSVWDCMPTSEQWDETKVKYADLLDKAINPPLAEPNVEISDVEDAKDESSKTEEDSKMEADGAEENKEKDEKDGETEEKVEETKEETEEKTVNEKPVETKVISDKDKKRLERLYKPFEHPTITVHPNKTAKNGKFDCQMMNLGSLLDYKTEDQKECTFEVSVFAEQFYEMIHRDAAFKMYKSLLMVPSQTEQKEEAADGDKPKNQIGNDLLMAFGIYDIDNAGYIKDNDLEEIIHSIGLDLARSQARKLIVKVLGRKNTFNYKEATIQENLNTLTDLELSKGNKVNLRISSDGDTVYLDSKQATLSKLKCIETDIKKIQTEFNSVKGEMDVVRKRYHEKMDLENNFRTELKSLEDELHTKRKSVREANQQQGIYSSLMSMAREVMERAKNKIDKQLEKDFGKETATDSQAGEPLQNGTQ